MPAINVLKKAHNVQRKKYRLFLCEVCEGFTEQSVTQDRDRLTWVCQTCKTPFTCIKTPYGWVPEALYKNPLRLLLFLRNVKDLAKTYWGTQK